jgi:cholesterol transport system auxiliary component
MRYAMHTPLLLPFSKLLFAGLATATLISCVSFGAKAPPALLVLTATNQIAPGATKTGIPSDALIVLLPDVPRKLDTNRVPIQISDSSIAYLKDAVWADKPSRLMQLLLVETITAKNDQLLLSEVDAGGKAGSYLSGSLSEFGIDTRSNQAVVIYDAVKIVKGSALQKRRFEARENVGAILPAPASAALNTAANKVARDIAEWIAAKP